jgi:hypothetical protein
MKKPTRSDLFSLASNRLRTDFEELRSIPHSGVKGTESEVLLRTFLNDHLPKRFTCNAGFLIDNEDNVSGHNDVIIYDALNCPLYRTSEESAIIPNDNVAAVIEVKSVLDKTRMAEAAEKIAEAKNLLKRRPQKTEAQRDELINWETLGVLFAYGSPLSMEKISEHYKKTILDKGIPHHIDYVFILDKAFLSLAADPYKKREWSPTVVYQIPPVEGMHLVVGAIETGEHTLSIFMSTLLAHLRFFRNFYSIPPFDWSTEKTGEKVRIDYLMSVSHEPDPNKRRFKLAIYQEEARKLIMGNDENTDST